MLHYGWYRDDSGGCLVPIVVIALIFFGCKWGMNKFDQADQQQQQIERTAPQREQKEENTWNSKSEGQQVKNLQKIISELDGINHDEVIQKFKALPPGQRQQDYQTILKSYQDNQNDGDDIDTEKTVCNTLGVSNNGSVD